MEVETADRDHWTYKANLASRSAKGDREAFEELERQIDKASERRGPIDPDQFVEAIVECLVHNPDELGVMIEEMFPGDEHAELREKMALLIQFRKLVGAAPFRKEAR